VRTASDRFIRLGELEYRNHCTGKLVDPWGPQNEASDGVGSFLIRSNVNKRYPGAERF